MTAKGGFAHSLVVLLLILGSFIAVFAFLVWRGYVKAPNIGFKKQASVEVKTEYQNPFKQEAQYVNPFDTYKSPFLSLK